MNQTCERKSWDYIFSLSKKVQKKIRKNNYNPDIIIGIARGGWVPARNLCDLLDVTDLLSIKIEHWGKTATPSGNAEIRYGVDANLKGKDVLVVDDLTDTGESMSKAFEYIKEYSPNTVKTASLIHLENSDFKPDFFGETLDEWKWIVFPWNVTEDLERLVKKILEEKGKKSLEGIKKTLQEKHSLALDGLDFNSIIAELKYRNVIDNEKNLYYLKKSGDI